MSATEELFPGLSAELSTRLGTIVRRFEQAWREGQHPTLEDFLPTEASECRAVLPALIRIDLNNRLQGGEAVCVASYLQRFPVHAETLKGLLADPPPASVAGQTTVDESHFTPFRAKPEGAAELPTIAGFDVLGVLGRGGMGVVYKARHRKLDRLVALKMIRAGVHGDEQDLSRFLLEARAVARLHHANIVQIYEIGEQDGQPYFCLEYMAGGSLAHQLAGQPQPGQVAAQLTEVLARAMHYAHRQNLIHRDLKPANILLQIADCRLQIADCPDKSAICNLQSAIVKITDFGLAKQLDDESGQTVSGALLGTPSYMAPEQAAGRTKDVGPLTDVYALGAILYELLTGKPPFKGSSVRETVEQVQVREPVSPCRLRPTIHRDLETICLKCLEKEPARRYASAEDLAEDLRRFLAREPIHARPVRAWERAWKWVRRRPASAALAALVPVLVAVALTAVWVWHHAEQVQEVAQETKQLADLRFEFTAGLKAPAWTAAHLEHMEELLTGLERLEPEQAPTARARLYERYAEAIRDSFSPATRPVLRPEDAPAIEEALARLAARAPERERELRQAFLARQRSWQQTLDLKPPFQELQGVIPARGLKQTELGLLPLPAKGNKDEPLVLTDVFCTRHCEIEAVLRHPSWENVEQLGLVLRVGKNQGYLFLLCVTPAPVDAVEGTVPPSFAEARRARRMLHLQIFRNQLRLRDQEVPASAVWTTGSAGDTLKLRARREGEELVFQVNGVKLEFRDLTPLSGREAGVFGLHWPAGVALHSLKAWRRELPEAASPLERGDELYAGAHYRQAQGEYRAQAALAPIGPVRDEALYKEGLCLLGLKETVEATDVFSALAAGSAEERWKLLATCQLWAIRLRQGQREEAEKLFAKLSPTYRFPDVALILPDQVREDILEHHRRGGVGQTTGNFLHRPQQVRDLERALEVEEFFQTPKEVRNQTRFYLFRAYWLAGQRIQAVKLATALYRDEPALTSHNREWWFLFCEDYSLFLRTRGQPVQALQDLDRRLFVKVGVPRPECVVLLVERACDQAALGKWKEAEADLDEFFRLAPAAKVQRRHWTQACLAQGFLRERRGDEVGAMTAWKQGLPGVGPGKAWEIDRTSPLAFAHQAILCSLAREFPDAAVEEVTDKVLEQMGGYTESAGIKTALKVFLPEFSPALLGPLAREMWHTDEGHALARQLALREKPIPEQQRAVLVYGFVCLTRKMLEPVMLSADQEALLRKLAEDGYEAAGTGKIGRKQLLAGSQLGMLWRGQPALLGWDMPARSFEPHLRGPLAYFLGLRYRDLYRNPTEAARYFRRALDAGPPSPLLRRLAEAELARINKK